MASGLESRWGARNTLTGMRVSQVSVLLRHARVSLLVCSMSSVGTTPPGLVGPAEGICDGSVPSLLGTAGCPPRGFPGPLPLPLPGDVGPP